MLRKETTFVKGKAYRALESALELHAASGSLAKAGCPTFARFSRDAGYHCTFPLTLDLSEALNGQHRWYPTSREKRARCGAPSLGEGTRGYLFGG